MQYVSLKVNIIKSWNLYCKNEFKEHGMCEGGRVSYIALTTRRLFRAETTPLPAKKKLIKKYIKKKPKKNLQT